MSAIMKTEGEIVTDGLSMAQVSILNKFRLLGRHFQSVTGNNVVFTLQQIEQIIKNEIQIPA